jgi:hypothetical protein
MKSFITTGIALFIFSACFSQQEPTGWRGPARDGVFPEKNLLTSWPAGGPGLLWSFEGLGYYVNGYGVVFCFDAANGDIRWKRDLLNECEGQTRSWGL